MPRKPPRIGFRQLRPLFPGTQQACSTDHPHSTRTYRVRIPYLASPSTLKHTHQPQPYRRIEQKAEESISLVRMRKESHHIQLALCYKQDALNHLSKAGGFAFQSKHVLRMTILPIQLDHLDSLLDHRPSITILAASNTKTSGLRPSTNVTAKLFACFPSITKQGAPCCACNRHEAANSKK